MDRTGYVRATLTSQPGALVAVPTLDKPDPLTMTDMMGAHHEQSAINDAMADSSGQHQHGMVLNGVQNFPGSWGKKR